MSKVYLVRPNSDNKRIVFGIDELTKFLKQEKYDIEYITEDDAFEYRKYDGIKIFAGNRNESELIGRLEDDGELLYHDDVKGKEGFYIATLPTQFFVISGADATGTLYGCMELIDQIKKNGGFMHEIFLADAPKLSLRGPVIGLQLTKIEPPRKTYEYPVTPGRFPWFYDKKHWEEMMDMMLRNRCNVLYLWSGHPFSSFIKLDKYPEALEVTEEEFVMNREIFDWLTEECDKRGIWVVLKFYNIHIPYPFAMKHGLDPLQSSIDPFVAQYTKECIVEFIKSFPHIGLMVCLGEALRGTQNKTDWFLETILPAVKQGVKEAGLTEEPPLILRGHDCDPNAIMSQAVHMYSNIYTMWKYNGESLTTFLPAGDWQHIHEDLSSHGQTHIMNIHVLANLEPFRFGAPSFVQKCVQAGQYRLGGNGIHLYPLFYWDWPYSPDKVEPRLKQIERDWLWYEVWFRYAWNPALNPDTEKIYWSERFAQHFGCDIEDGTKILEAIECAGEVAPRILRRVGITEGNRQTMSLGMQMTQFTHVKKYRPNVELWKSASTLGEIPDEYVERELKGERHIGETPLDMVKEVTYFANRAKSLIGDVKSKVTLNAEEYGYWETDIEAISLMADSYGRKIEAAIKIITYKNTMGEDLHGDLTLLEEAQVLMKESLEIYRNLAQLTDKTYLYANSMQTPQRKIPFPDGEKYGHWTQCLPEYEKEYANFAKHVEEMKNGIYPSEETEDLAAIKPLAQAKFKVLTEGYPTYEIKKGNNVFTDAPSKIQNIAPEIKGLTGISMSKENAIKNGAKFKIEFEEDSQLLIGYFKVKGKNNKDWMRVPDLETNTHADDRGGLSCVIGEALKVDNSPVVNVHVFQYEKGIHEISMDMGAYAILGVVPAGVQIKPRHAGLAGDTLDMLDWMFEA